MNQSGRVSNSEIKYVRQFLARPEIVDMIANPYTLKYLGVVQKQKSDDIGKIGDWNDLSKDPKERNLQKTANAVDSNHLAKPEASSRNSSRKNSRTPQRTQSKNKLGTIVMPGYSSEGANLNDEGI